MITHFAEFELPTVSIAGTKQVYADALGFDVVAHTEERISFRISKLSILSFREVFAPLSPAHFAFAVPFSKFKQAAEHIRTSGLLVARWPNGDDVRSVSGNNGLSMYFRDGDGNILEIIAYEHIPEDVLQATGLLHTLYLREIGFPVQDVAALRAWLHDNLNMTSAYGDRDDFNFVFSGTAYTVTVPTSRPWVPIAMRALPPNMRVVFGTPDRAFVGEVADKLEQSRRLLLRTDEEILFRYDEYMLGLRHSPDVPGALSASAVKW